MDRGKLTELITRKNERLEEEALDRAGDLIASIVAEQQRIKVAETRIEKYRKELATLEVEQLDQSAVLGGE